MAVDLFSGSVEVADVDAAQAETIEASEKRTLEDDLKRAYEDLFTERDARKARLEQMRRGIEDTAGICDRMADVAFGDEFALAAVEKCILEDLTDGKGRAYLGLNPDVEINTYELEAKYLRPLEELRRSRPLRTRRQSEADFQAQTAMPEPKLDIAGLIAELQAKYGGAPGRAIRLGQVVSSLMTSLSLGGTEFEVVAGKVSLNLHAYGIGHGPGYSYNTKDTLYRIASGFEAMLEELDEPVSQGLREFKMRGIDGARAGDKQDLSADLCFRFFKSHIRLHMSAGFAEKLREFIATHRA